MNDRDFSISPGFLTTVIGAGSLIIAWAFVVGWAYLRTFFELFGVNVGTLNFSTYHYLLFCFAQLVSFGCRGQDSIVIKGFGKIKNGLVTSISGGILKLKSAFQTTDTYPLRELASITLGETTGECTQ